MKYQCDKMKNQSEKSKKLKWNNEVIKNKIEMKE